MLPAGYERSHLVRRNDVLIALDGQRRDGEPRFGTPRRAAHDPRYGTRSHEFATRLSEVGARVG